jgi:membrane-associated phospholipid phosphatase
VHPDRLRPAYRFRILLSRRRGFEYLRTGAGQQPTDGTAEMTGETGETGETGGAMPLPYLSVSYLPGAMLTTRDGIVGAAWSKPTGQPSILRPDDPDPMSRWEPWVRRQVIGFELLSSLKFSSKGTAADAQGTLSAASGDLVTIYRPAPAVIRRTQLPIVFGYADLRRDRASEIQSQITEFFPFFATVCHLHPDRSRFTLELLTALRFAVVATQMRVKHALAMPRPVDYSAQIMPMIQTPGHSTFPAGHAVESFMFATVLAKLTAGREKQLYGSDRRFRDKLMWLAARISINRVVAGVHFPVDIAAGMVLGLQLGRYFGALFRENAEREKQTAKPLQSWTFDARNYGEDDFRWGKILETIDNDNNEETLSPEKNDKPFLERGNPCEPEPLPADSPLLWLWQHAAAEWK